ncbi:MAG TPA: glucokinase, partial [Thermoanaerobaculia bacterium]
MRLLAGDIGGTKTALAIVEAHDHRISVVRMKRFPSGAYAGLSEIVEEFLASEKLRLGAAAFGVAGPVRAGRAKVTKLPWRLDERRLARAIGIPRVRLVNDFVAAALGLRYVRPGHLATLCRGRAEVGAPIGILGAGTGLGQAVVLRRGKTDEIVASEGGHVDFGPRRPVEDRLVLFLRERFARATRDRILSGSGL